MKQQNIAAMETSSVTWENMDTWVRAQVQGFIQQVLEEEVTAFLGRQKSQRRGAVEAAGGYRNGVRHTPKSRLICAAPYG